jgi:hypothetical protein
VYTEKAVTEAMAVMAAMVAMAVMGPRQRR